MEEKKRRNRRSSKEIIYAAARELYYAHGLDAVSFDEIAERCRISKQLIRYHFGSKAQLANEIYGRFAAEQWAVFLKKARKRFPEEPEEVLLTAYSFAVVDYFKADEKAFRYYTQFFSESFTQITVGVEQIASGGRAGAVDSAADDEAHMRYIGGQYAARGLIYHYVTGEIRCPREQFLLFYFMMCDLNVLQLTDKAREALFRRILQITDSVEIHYLPGFYWQ